MRQTKKIGLWLIGVLALVAVSSESRAQPIRVACVGDSITAGVGTANISFESYPALLRRMLGPDYEVKNFGSSGATLGNKGNSPYQKTGSFKGALAFKPDIVVIMLGTNDSKPVNWAFKDQFEANYKDLLRQFRELESKPRIYLCTAPFVPGTGNFTINEENVKEQLPMVEALAKEEGLPLIDNHEATKDKDALFPDRVHPNAEGAAILARTVYAGLMGKAYEGEIPMTYDLVWNGFKLQEFQVANRTCRLVFPEKPLAGNPWIWRTEFFDAFPMVDVALAKAGYHVAYMDVSGMFGAPKALDLMDSFYDFTTSHHGLNKKTVLEGFSRGGLFALNWAARHPDRVASIYLDAPVCDFKSWPAGKGSRPASPGDWAACLKAYGFTEEQALAYTGNPVDNLKPLADARLPIIAVYGDADKTVAPEENILLLEKRYKEMGGDITLIAKPGVDHHPHSLSDPKPVVDFVINHP